MFKIKNLRWLIVVLLFVATALSFLDRQVLSISILKIQADLDVSDVQYGWINTGFLISYALMFTLGGWLIDKFGTRIGLAISVGLWSISNAMHGVVQNVWHLGTVRFFLGIGEGGCFPGAAKGVTEWFPQKQRALAMGIAIGGAALGAVIAPPLTVYLISIFGWRGAFVATGIFGGLWVLVWLIFFHKPERSPFITKSELALIEQDRELEQEKKTKKISVPIKQILRTRQAWGLISIRFLLDPVFYFFMFWIPKYLSEERGVSFERIGELFWIPFFALGISNIIGGGVSDRLIKSGMSVNRARKTVMGLAAGLTMVAPLTVVASSAEVAIIFMSLIMFAHGFWITNYITITSELFGKNATSTVVGMCGTAGAIAGLLINPMIGKIVENYSYLPLWITSGILYPLGFIVLLLTIRKIRPLEFQPKNNVY
jgi:ACS family hexuronate transporter-like MFS transporter